jgi:hypothetical protein
MPDSCIDRAMDAIRARRTPSRPEGLATNAVGAKLVALLPECTDELIRLAESQLESTDNLDEFALDALLEALSPGNTAQVLSLTRRALESPGTRLKEEYASMLTEAGYEETATTALMRVLERGLEQEREDIPETIRAVHASRITAAVPLVGNYLADPRRAVRMQAVDFLYDCAGDPAVVAHALLSRLDLEEDPDVLEQIIGALDRWDWLPAKAALERFALHGSAADGIRDEAADVARRLGSG